MINALDDTFRIVVIGDFSGDSMINGSDIRPLKIDRDNFDAIMRKIGIRLSGISIGPNNEPISLSFPDMDSFHPDRIFAELNLFSSLRHMRERLQDPHTFDVAAAEFLSWSGIRPQASEPPIDNESEQTPSGVTSAESLEGLLDQILEPSESPVPPGTVAAQSSNSHWQQMIEAIVAPYLLPGANPQQAEVINCLDASIQASMTALLHHPSFREIESTWRAVHLLVHRLETDDQLSVHLVDLSKANLAADLCNEATQSTIIHQLLIDQTLNTPGGKPWSLIVGNYTFGTEAEDTNLLDRLARLAAACGAPFIAGADLTSFGSVASDSWQKLRASAEATYLGLVWPRFLLRLPYGANTKPIDAFAYEEMTAPDRASDLLWGNPAFLCALLLGQSFSQYGWSLRPGQLYEISRLPVWMYDHDGETELHPCGERILTDSASEQLLSLGIMPVISIRDQDIVRLPYMVSLNGEQLHGPWNT